MFDLFNRASSCCWISTRNYVYSWNMMTSIDLGVRSDTNAPNKSPDIAILPFIRYMCADVVKPVKPAWLENGQALTLIKAVKPENDIHLNQHATKQNNVFAGVVFFFVFCSL